MSFNRDGLTIGRGVLNTHTNSAGLATHSYISADDLASVIAAPGYFPDNLGSNSEDVKLLDLLLVRDSVNTFTSYRIDALSPIALTAVTTDANPFDQSLNTTDAVTFATVNTGQGANELYPMDQGVLTTDSPTFDTVTTTTGFVMPTTGGTPATLSYYETGSFQFNWTGGFTGTIQQTVNFTRLGNIIVLAFDSVTVAQTGVGVVTSGTDLPVRLRSGMQYAFYNPSVVDNTVPVDARFVLNADGSAVYSKGDGGNFSGVGNLQLQESTVTYLIV